VALNMLKSGQYTIKTKKQAVEALQMMETLKAEIAELEAKYGISEMQQDATELKKAVTRYCEVNDIDRIDFTTNDVPMHGTLVSGFDKKWLLTDEDLRSAGQPKGAKSLRRILRKKISPAEFKQVWARVTKRVVDPEGINELVDEGMLDESDVAPALVEKPRASYLRIFKDD